jgi:FkbM family methyltransferase
MGLRHTLQRSLRKAGLLIERDRNPFADQRLLLGAEPRVIFDCGASVGTTAESYRSLFPRAAIYSFEPSETLQPHLRAVAKRLGNVTVVPFGVSDTAGESQFFEYEQSGFNSTSRCTLDFQQKPKKVTSVTLCTIDEFCAAERIDCIDILKLDIQGGELKALRGAARMLSARSVFLIYSEVLFQREYEEQSFYHEIADFLAAHGYWLFRLYDLRYSPERSLECSDAIFCRNDILASKPLLGRR